MLIGWRNICCVLIFTAIAFRVCAEESDFVRQGRLEFEKRLQWYTAGRAELKTMLSEQMALRAEAQAGMSAEDAGIAAENAEAVRLLDEAIALTRQKLSRIELNITVVEHQAALCERIRQDIERTKKQLVTIQKSIRTGNAELEDWAAQSEEARKTAKKISYDLLQKGLMGKIGKLLDEEIKTLGNTERAAEYKRLKDAIDESTSVIGHTEAAGDFMHTKNVENSLGVLISLIDDPQLQKALSYSEDLGPLTGFLKYHLDYAYQAAVYGVSWARINQHAANTDKYLESIKSLQETMIRQISELEQKHCGSQGGAEFV